MKSLHCMRAVDFVYIWNCKYCEILLYVYVKLRN